jgi:2-iminobutanoate/2-iminopropanoate deaminase
MRNVVCTTGAPNAIGPYSQAVKGLGFIFVSGQLALNPATQQIIEGDARQQTERVLQNIAAILKTAGSSMDKVVRCGVFLKNMSDFEAMNDVYGKIFGPHPPARTTVEVARLPKDSLVEIDAIALG